MCATGRFVVVHVSGEHPDEVNDAGGGPECDGRTEQESREEITTTTTTLSGEGEEDEQEQDQDQKDDDRRRRRMAAGRGRWEPGFLREELMDTCLRQLEIPASASILLLLL